MFPPLRVAKKNLTRAAGIAFFVGFFEIKKKTGGNEGYHQHGGGEGANKNEVLTIGVEVVAGVVADAAAIVFDRPRLQHKNNKSSKQIIRFLVNIIKYVNIVMILASELTWWVSQQEIYTRYIS